MLNTKKLLFILPELAYVAELLPAKKPNTFAIQAFRQINGEFMDDNEFIAKNVIKLFGKLEKEEYQLILPDFLFTNTIVTVKETGEAKVKKYLSEKLLPSLDLSTDTHEIETTVLTQLKGQSKVQLSAIEKSVLSPVRVGASESEVKISGVSALSWAIKSVISLEPSISVLHIGETVYSALQYIGVDQTNQAPVTELEAIAETIKTLKGAEPSIQTIYVLSNALVEEKLKELLSDTIPIQQLSTLRDDEAKMPSYVKDIIEFSMRTLSIKEYSAPVFPVGKASSEELSAQPEGGEVSEDTESESESKPEAEIESLPEIDEDTAKESDEPATTDDGASETEITEVASESVVMPDAETTPELPPEKVDAPSINPISDIVLPAPTITTTDDIDLSKFSAKPTTSMSSQGDAMETKNDQIVLPEIGSTTATESAIKSGSEITPPLGVVVPPPKKEVIKNSSGIGPMLKMVFITLAVFAVTVAVGIGVGLGLLQLNGSKENSDASPVVVTTPSPVASPVAMASPSASPSAAIDPKSLSILIVNATTKAGYAGQIQDKLDAAKVGTTATGNAKGDYETGSFALLAKEDKAMTEFLSKATGLKVTFDATLKKTVEDASDKYDAVVVLAE